MIPSKQCLPVGYVLRNCVGLKGLNVLEKDNKELQIQKLQAQSSDVID